MEHFSPFGWMHGIVTVVSAGGWLLIVYAARATVGTPREQTFRRVFGLVILAVNVARTVHNLTPEHWDLRESLPLHACDMAWMAAAWSFLSGAEPGRLRHQLVYYWGFGLSSVAYFTPTLELGPASIHFWEFWSGHWLILAAAFLNVAAFRVRPSWDGYVRTSAVTAAILLPVTIFNIAFDTSYFYTGRFTPSNPTPLDALGPWPLRIVWMVLIGSVVFALMTLPAGRRRTTTA